MSTLKDRRERRSLLLSLLSSEPRSSMEIYNSLFDVPGYGARFETFKRDLAFLELEGFVSRSVPDVKHHNRVFWWLLK